MRPGLSWVGLLVLLAGAGCTKRNPAYCEDPGLPCDNGAMCDPVNNTCGPAPDAAPPDATPIACTTSAQCPDPTVGVCDQGTGQCRPCATSDECLGRGDALAVCEPVAHECVVCVVDDDCPNAMPVCDGATHTCGPCSADAQCAARAATVEVGVCDYDGSCPGVDDVIIVDDAALDCGGSAMGTVLKPYCTIQDGIDNSVTQGKTRLLVRPGHYQFFLIGGGLRLTLFAMPGTFVDQGNSDDTRVTVDGAGTDLTMRGFDIGLATTGYGVLCQGGSRCTLDQVVVHDNSIGVFATDVEALTVRRSAVHHNTGGGINTEFSDFVIENNLVYRNGSSGAPFGGARLTTSHVAGGARQFAFNTMWKNSATAGAASGVQCTLATILSSSILWANGATTVTGPMCDVRFSVIDDAVIAALPNNTGQDPLFVSQDLLSPDLHILAGSPAISLADATAAPLLDHFGQQRDATPDSGADEQGSP